MRRHDREITDEREILDFISKEQILRVAFYDDGDIYIVPVNYGFTYDGEYTFYFHGAKAGRKYELAKTDPLVGFEIDGNYSLIEGTDACSYSATFQSVVGTGTLSLLETPKEKVHGLNTIMKQSTSNDDFEYDDKMVEMVAIFALKVKMLSCKRKG